jgi:hypothetical protein
MASLQFKNLQICSAVIERVQSELRTEILADYLQSTFEAAEYGTAFIRELARGESELQPPSAQDIALWADDRFKKLKTDARNTASLPNCYYDIRTLELFERSVINALDDCYKVIAMISPQLTRSQKGRTDSPPMAVEAKPRANVSPLQADMFILLWKTL